MRRQTILFLLLLTSFPSFAASGPLAVTAAIEKPAVSQSNVSIASNGTEALAVWAEGDSDAIYARRYTANGFDGEPIALAESSTGAPAVTATTDGWLVAWPVVDGTRVQSIGSGQLPAPVTIATPRSCAGLSLASTGSRALLVSGTCGDMSANVLDSRGNPVGSAISLAQSTGYSHWGDVVAEGSSFLVINAIEQWNGASEHDTLQATRIGTDGGVAGSFVVADVDGAIDHISATFDGARTTVAWISRLTPYVSTIESKATTATAPQKASDEIVDDVVVASGGGTTWIALRAYGGKGLLERAMLGGTAASLTTIAPRAWWPSMTVLNGQPLLAWTSAGPTFTRVFLQAGDTAAVPIAPNAPDRAAADAVSAPAGVVAVWEEDFGGVEKIAVGGVDGSWQRVAGSGSIVSGTTIGARLPAIAAGNGGFLVAWFDVDAEAVMARRLNAALQPVDSAAIKVGNASMAQPSIAFDGTNWLVVYIRQDDPSLAAAVVAARVSSSGAVLDDPALSISPFSWLVAGTVDATWDGKAFRVVWGASKSVRGVIESEVRSATVDSSGSVVAVANLSPDRIGYSALAPRVERGGDWTLTTWIESSGVNATLQPRNTAAILPPQRRRAVWTQQMMVVPPGQVLTTGPLVFDGALFHLFWRSTSDPSVSREVLVSPVGYVSLPAVTFPPIVAAAQYADGIALVTSDRTKPPGLFWTMR